MVNDPATSDPSDVRSSVPPSSRGTEGIYWVVAGGLLVVGIMMTTMSLVLPTTPDLLPARIISTASGVLLTSLSGIVASYVLTRAITVQDVEKKYINILDGIARSLAHIYSGLQAATSSRRSNNFTHEETYQEAVLGSANSVLAQFDSVTRLSGPISGAFKKSKNDLNEIRSMLFYDDVYDSAVTAVTTLTGPKDQKVFVACPNCSSRVAGNLLMQPGWTASLHCSNCQTRFNIHRRGDLTVYSSQPTSRPPLTSAPWESTADEPDVGEPQHAQVEEAAPPAVSATISCPGCGTEIVLRLDGEHVADGRVVRRICLECARVLEIDAGSRAVVSSTAGEFYPGQVVGRKAAYAKVSCPTDGHILVATFPRRSRGTWVAVCTIHHRAIEVTREQAREWMKVNDEPYFEQRRTAEEGGAVRVILDPE